MSTNQQCMGYKTVDARSPWELWSISMPVPRDRVVIDLATMHYVIVIAQLTGIYGSKPTESEGAARGQGCFTLPGNWAIQVLYYIPSDWSTCSVARAKPSIATAAVLQASKQIESP